ncbi:MAG: EamA family transporter [Roseibium sp.]|uniref:DMT family transporter n=1 Tax=Roseibium sp. TaxID=1936156 RepID=UPI001B0CE522|nr:DMT family transporter [Roseibium sp.]MBO6893486.1 EamA family transporter [Roseibium sp.]MBO6931747.1 EamA family transporter [Roseibium sp.]
MNSSFSRRALGFGIVAALLFGTHAVVARFLTGDLHGLQIAVLRLWIASAILLLILKARGLNVFPIRFDRFKLVAILGFVLNYAVFHIGLERTSATNAMVLENTAPFFVLLLLAGAGIERVRLIDIVATLLVMSGVFLTVRHDFDPGATGSFGDILMIAAGFTWALFIIGSSRCVQNTEAPGERLQLLFQVLLCSAVILTPGFFLYPFSPTAEDMFWLVFLAVFPTAFGYFLWYEAMAGVSTVTSALLFVLSVVFTFINAAIFLGEPLTLDIVLGGALVIIAVILPSLFSAGKEPDLPETDERGSSDP